ncbi:MAG: glycosyl transferase family 2 [Flavobacteriales bacterium]|nr:MAG: glycosyl transferase family 2 [Flavobacteriales bacterium]
MELHFSIIVPVYNRPKEIKELLESIADLDFSDGFEVVIVEDGSPNNAKEIVAQFSNHLNIKYFYKENTGAGQSRNFGMLNASGNYFVILDSDCLLPKDYLNVVKEHLSNKYTDAYGGPDANHASFSSLQKAIGYAMTSFLTTGGLRGSKKLREKFQLRSFNMGISKVAFKKTSGFRPVNFGEDIDLTFRLWKAGCTTQFIEQAFVYHKRRISWSKFFRQTFNFGAARPILNKMHPKTAKITYWFPAFYIFFIAITITALLFKNGLPLILLIVYFLFIIIHSSILNRSFVVGLQSVIAAKIMFFGYGLGFLRSQFRKTVLKKPIEEVFPIMFRR